MRGAIIAYVSKISPWLIEHEASWERAMGELRKEGWVVALASPAAPVQLEGRTPTGEPGHAQMSGVRGILYPLYAIAST